jgi:hypothetical protein
VGTRWNTKTDAEKKAAGTYRKGTVSEAAHARKLSENVYAHPTFQDVPDPQLPFNDVGMKKYFEVCGMLLGQGKLTAVTRDIAEQIALLVQDQHTRLAKGLMATAFSTNQLQRLLSMLKIADEASPIGIMTADRMNRFRSSGSPNRQR